MSTLHDEDTERRERDAEQLLERIHLRQMAKRKSDRILSIGTISALCAIFAFLGSCATSIFSAVGIGITGPPKGIADIQVQNQINGRRIGNVENRMANYERIQLLQVSMMCSEFEQLTKRISSQCSDIREQLRRTDSLGDDRR